MQRHVASLARLFGLDEATIWRLHSPTTLAYWAVERAMYDAVHTRWEPSAGGSGGPLDGNDGQPSGRFLLERVRYYETPEEFFQSPRMHPG